MIRINKKWYIDADRHGYILCKTVKAKNKKTGEEYMTDRQVSFHPTVSAALNYFVRLHHKKLVAEQEMTLQESIEKYKEIERFVFKTVNENII